MRSDSELEPAHLEPISSVHQMVAKVLNHALCPNPLKSAQQLKQEVVHKKDALWDRCERYSGEEKWGFDTLGLWPHTEKMMQIQALWVCQIVY